MNKLKHILIIILLLHVITANAQKVSNIAFRQEQSKIIISYGLETKIPCKIALFVSTNGGSAWQGPLKKVSGDIGANVSSGNKFITWNVLEEFEVLSGNNIVFQVRATSNELLTVKIGSQEWTKKNLDVSTYRNGDIIPEVKDLNEWSKLTTGAWCYYDNDPKNGKIYGKLYNWYAVNDPRGLAPEGYHVPSEDEWKELVNFLGGIKNASDKMKEIGFIHWESPGEYSYLTNPETPANNSSNFTGLPGGARSDSRYILGSGGFHGIGTDAYWWSSSKWDYTNQYYKPTQVVEAFGLNLANLNDNVYYQVVEFNNGRSVRCIRD